MKVTHLSFNPYTFVWSLSAIFNNGTHLSITITADAAHEMKNRDAVERSAFNGDGEFDSHILYWRIRG